MHSAPGLAEIPPDGPLPQSLRAPAEQSLRLDHHARSGRHERHLRAPPTRPPAQLCHPSAEEHGADLRAIQEQLGHASLPQLSATPMSTRLICLPFTAPRTRWRGRKRKTDRPSGSDLAMLGVCRTPHRPGTAGNSNRLHKFAKEGNYYGILGVAPGADGAKIQAAYYQLSRDWHPDRHFRRKLGDDAARIEFIFVNITKAYKVLSDEDARRRYHRDNKEMISLARAKQNDAEPGSQAQRGPVRRPRPPVRSGPAVGSGQQRSAPLANASRRSGRFGLAMKRLREQVKGRSSRARRYFEQGQKDYNAGEISKAVSSLHLAVQFDSENKEYRALYELARSEASSSLSVQYTQAGESAESFQNYKEAMFNYERACEQNPEDGPPLPPRRAGAEDRARPAQSADSSSTGRDQVPQRTSRFGSLWLISTPSLG